ncbi:MAG TPA: methyltransferase domain-containing protein [Anaerolineae bacterium]|jgi:2-polyprenyl-3-methyl-5-hydroxy-6-metoxy-1,4-benzoquinol methylase
MNHRLAQSTEQRYYETALAFDSVAAAYDGELGNNRLVRQMRAPLWTSVERLAAPGAHLLDLGCGAGLDAVHFAQLGYTVTALDASVGMLEQTKRLAARHQVSESVMTLNLGIQQLDLLDGERYDLIYSDMGALNCLADLTRLAGQCAHLTLQHGHLVFSVIGRNCPWEALFYTLRGQVSRARIRAAVGQVPVSLNGRTVWTRYYSPRELYRLFEQLFRHRSPRALNLFLPPPYLIGGLERHPALYGPLAWLDRHLGRLPLINQMGDHFLIEMERRE